MSRPSKYFLQLTLVIKVDNRFACGDIRYYLSQYISQTHYKESTSI